MERLLSKMKLDKRIKRWIVALMSILLMLTLPISGICDYKFSDDADAIEEAADSVFMLEVYSAENQQIAVGSGFVAFDSTLLITNNHVIEDGAYVIAISDEKERFLINRVACRDAKRDIAILQFDQDSGVQPLPLEGDKKLKRSQTVVAIGSPAGLMNTVSVGNISAFYVRDGRDWIQFTAPISSGSSGGALFNDEGEIIGITTATYASAQNVNMAVRIQEAISLYNQWDKKVTIAMSPSAVSPRETIAALSTGASQNYVWVSKGGKRYHSNSSCSGMKNPVEMDLMEAMENGYEPCGKCFR